MSDLWLDSADRGKGLCLALMICAARNPPNIGVPTFSVSRSMTIKGASTYYDALGFKPVKAETVMVLTGLVFQRMRRSR